MNAPVHGYVTTQFAVVVGAAMALALWSGLTWPVLVVGAAWLLISLLSFDGMLEGRQQAAGLETARLGLTAIAAAAVLWKAPELRWAVWVPAGVAALSLGWLRWLTTARATA